MNKIEKIKAEIERRKGELKRDKYISIDSRVCRLKELSFLEKFITSLSEELSENIEHSEDLEKAAEDIYKIPFGTRAEDFKAGVEWQREQIDEGKAMLHVADKSYKIGRRDCKYEMMKDAVEGTVMDFSSTLPRPQINVLLDPHKYHNGDKVKIIIVKED